MGTKMQALATLGQSIWLDDLSRNLLNSGELEGLIQHGLRGVTSNPTIFEHAILSSTVYDGAIRDLANVSTNDVEIFEALIIEDIRRAADLFRPVYRDTNALDGYVSLEVSPELAYDTEQTLAAARRLWSAVDRPNLMIKVPGTRDGWPAIETLLAEGINVNVTLLFSIANYERVAQAFLRALEMRCGAGESIAQVASVASFFVSRVDTVADKKLGVSPLAGKLAIANAALAYERFLEIERSTRWQALRQQGAMPQRLLWASTGVKNPAYSPLHYVEALIGADTVDTLPPETLQRLEQDGKIANNLSKVLSSVAQTMKQAKKAGIDLVDIAQQLEEEGVEKFAQSYAHVLQAIAQKRRALLQSSARVG